MKNLLTFVVCLLIGTASVLAQTNSGAIRGSVLDPSGASVAGATVTARKLDTGLTVTAKATDAGIYSIPNLPPGTYSVTVDGGANFKKFEQTGVTVQTSSTTSLDINLQLGSVSETVNVSANATQLQTDTSDVGSNVQQSLVENLPLEVSGTLRNPVQFITLVPGFVGKVGNNPGDNSTDDYKLNGGQEGGTDILVDGLSISLVSANIQQNKGVSPEAVQEFKVLQSNFSAEYGFSGDSIINLTMKSGTNRFHGDVYDFLRNRVLDGSSWHNNTNGPNCPPTPDKPGFVCKKALNTQNDFGFLVSGPISLPRIYNGKDKTFFMFAFEGFRFSQGNTSTSSFPNEAFRKGDFSALLPATQLFDPTTKQPIPGNILSNDPNFKPSAVMTKVFSLLPATNGSLTNKVNNVNTLSRTTANLFDIKIDHTISDKQRISGGFDWDNTKSGSVVSIGPIFGGSTPQNTRYARFSHDYTFTPSLFNHFLLGFSRRFRIEGSNSIGEGFPAKIGLTGVENSTFPCIKFFGGPYREVINNCGDSQFADNVYQLADSVSWIRGKHNLKFGGEMRALQFNVRRLTQSSGEFHFDPSETSLKGVGGDAVASSLFGLVHEATVNFGQFSGVRYKNYAFYAQDSYKWSPRLTLNLGLRYDYALPASEAFDRFSAVDPTLANPGAGNILGAYTYFGQGAGRNGRKRLQDTYTKAFGPRLGFAYKINDKTVLRGGYGIFYEPLKEPSFADQDSLGFFNKESISSANGAPFQIDSGVPQVQAPSGPLTPEARNGQGGVILVPRNSGRPADIQSWNLDVQRQISTNLMVDVAYVGSKGTHLPGLNIIPNQVNPGFLSRGACLQVNVANQATDPACAGQTAVALPFPTFTGTVAQALRPFPQYGDFNQEDNSFGPDRTGNSTYHALQTRVTKRFAEGLSFLVSYTISKNITDADSIGPGVSGFIGNNGFIGQNSYNRRAEKAVSQLDTPQSLVVSFFYEVPTGRGKRYLNQAGALDRVVGGWHVSAIVRYSSGIPTAVYTGCGNTAGGRLFGGCNFTGLARVNVIPGVPQTNKGNFNPNTTSFFNAAAFAPAPAFTFGNEPRALANARDFSGKGEDFVLGKRTRLFGEKASIDFRAEFFNLFNRHIFQAPGGFSTPLGTPFQPAGSTGCSGPFACGFGAVTDSSGPRTIQFGLKITY